MRKEYDEVIRRIADVTHLDFYYVERMLRNLVEDVMQENLNKEKKHGA